MDAYSEVEAIYFSIADRTAFAKYLGTEIVKGSYLGSPPYQELKSALSEEHKKYHAAEHQVYNSFMNKIKSLNKYSALQVLQNYIPSLEESRQQEAFSFLCGTTIWTGSLLIFFNSLILSYINFLFKLNNYLHLSLLAGSAIFSLLIIFHIQKRLYLAKPDDRHLVLALEALKEIIK